MRLSTTVCYQEQTFSEKFLANELFGREDKATWSLKTCKLPRHPGVEIKTKKLLSLAKKLGTIPVEYRHYYPQQEDQQADETDPKGPLCVFIPVF